MHWNVSADPRSIPSEDPTPVKKRFQLSMMTNMRTLVLFLAVAVIGFASHAQAQFRYGQEFPVIDYEPLEPGEFTTLWTNDGGANQSHFLSNTDNVFSGTPFNFKFFGEALTDFTVYSNGYVTFNSTDPRSDNFGIHDEEKLAKYFFLFHDSIAPTGATGYVRIGVRGTSPFREFIVEYRVQKNSAGSMRGQLVFYETVDMIEFRYDVAANQDWRNVDATIGLQFDPNDEEKTILLDPDSQTGEASDAPTAFIRLIPENKTVWLGVADRDWSNAANWDNGVPDEDLTAVVRGGSNNPPILSSDTVVGNLQLATSAELTINDAKLHVRAGPTGNFQAFSGAELHFVDDAQLLVAGDFELDPTAFFRHYVGGIKDVGVEQLVSGKPDLSGIQPIVLNGSGQFGPQFVDLQTRTLVNGDVRWVLPTFNVEPGTLSPTVDPQISFTSIWDASYGYNLVVDSGASIEFQASADLSGYDALGTNAGNPEIQLDGVTLGLKAAIGTLEFTLPPSVDTFENVRVNAIDPAALIDVKSGFFVDSQMTVEGEGSLIVRGSMGDENDPIPFFRNTSSGDFTVEGSFHTTDTILFAMDTVNNFTVEGDLVVVSPTTIIEVAGDMNIDGVFLAKDDLPNQGGQGTLSVKVGGDLNVGGQVLADSDLVIENVANVSLGGLESSAGTVSVIGADVVELGTADPDIVENGVVNATSSFSIEADTSINISAVIGDPAGLTGPDLTISGNADFSADVSHVNQGTFRLIFFRVPEDNTFLTIRDANGTEHTFEFSSIGSIDPNAILIDTTGLEIPGQITTTRIGLANALITAINGASPAYAMTAALDATNGDVNFSGFAGTGEPRFTESSDDGHAIKVYGYQTTFDNFTITTTGDVSFAGTVRFSGNISDSGTGATFASTGDFVFGGDNPQTVSAINREFEAGRFVVAPGASVSFEGTYTTTTIGLIIPGVHFRKDSTVTLLDDATFKVGANGGEGFVKVDGRLISTSSSSDRPLIEGPDRRDSHIRVSFSPTSTIDVDGLIFENVGNQFSSYGVIINSGATISRFDNVSILEAESLKAAMFLGSGTLPLEFRNFEIDGGTAKSIDASGVTNGWDGITFPPPDALVQILVGANDGGNLFGSVAELDPNAVLNWEVVDQNSPPLQINNFELSSVGMTIVPPNLSNWLLPEAQVGQLYSFDLNAVGGNPPYQYTFFGAADDWLTIDQETGVLSNVMEDDGFGNLVPKLPGAADAVNRPLSITIVDSTSSTAGGPLTLTFAQATNPRLSLRVRPEPPPALDITNDPDLDGTFEFIPTTVQFEATGGVPPYSWVINSGNLPNGMPQPPVSLVNGELTGTPGVNSKGTYLFDVTVTDFNNNSSTKQFTLTVGVGNAPPIVSTTSLDPATENEFYSAELELAPGTGRAPFQWVLSPLSEPLPTGLTLSEDGFIRGFPRRGTARITSGVAIPYQVIVEVRDAFYPSQPASTSLVLPLVVNEEDLGPVDLNGENHVGGGCSVGTSRSWTGLFALLLAGLGATLLIRRRRDFA